MGEVSHGICRRLRRLHLVVGKWSLVGIDLLDCSSVLMELVHEILSHVLLSWWRSYISSPFLCRLQPENILQLIKDVSVISVRERLSGIERKYRQENDDDIIDDLHYAPSLHS